MATLLLIVIYIAFIGLGIPDSLFGTAWPAIYSELSLPVSWASFVTMIISGGTILSSLMASRLIDRFGPGRITAFSTTLTALALFGFSFGGGIAWLCLCALPLGLGAGAIDTALNNYVALHYKATHMNFLHCFYGIGVSVSPFLMSLALSSGSWRSGYRIISYCQLGIALLAICALPLWKRVRHAGSRQAEDSHRSIGIRTLLRNPKVRTTCLVFFGSCGLEYTTGIWGSTFLVAVRGAAVDAAALAITFYYAGMALGRFLSGLLAARLSSDQLVSLGQGTTLIALLLVLLPLPTPCTCAGLFLIGLGNGPVFPNMLHLTPQYFGAEMSQSVMGIQMTCSYLGILLAPALFGVIAQQISPLWFPCYLIAQYGLMITGSILLCRRRHAEKYS